MAGELFDRIEAEDSERLRKAGWKPCKHITGYWLQPNGQCAVSQAEALRRIEREEQQRNEQVAQEQRGGVG